MAAVETPQPVVLHQRVSTGASRLPSKGRQFILSLPKGSMLLDMSGWGVVWIDRWVAFNPALC